MFKIYPTPVVNTFKWHIDNGVHAWFIRLGATTIMVCKPEWFLLLVAKKRTKRIPG